MIKPGYIRLIDGKVKFEYYELEKPNYNDYEKVGYYQLDLEKYLASKRTIEVSNVDGRILINRDINGEPELAGELDNKQPCKAEVGKTATIIKLTKE